MDELGGGRGGGPVVWHVGGPGYINVEASEQRSPRQAWKQGCGWGAGGHGPVTVDELSAVRAAMARQGNRSPRH